MSDAVASSDLRGSVLEPRMGTRHCIAAWRRPKAFRWSFDGASRSYRALYDPIYIIYLLYYIISYISVFYLEGRLATWSSAPSFVAQAPRLERWEP